VAKKRRPGPAPRPAAEPAAAAATASTAASAAVARNARVSGEPSDDGWTVALLALLIFLAPAAGVPSEEMLQDTLKSAIVSFGALTAALLFLLSVRKRREPLRWHAVLWLPLLLMAYALGSIAWSHHFLASVEAIRWFVFSLIAWLGLNTLARDRLPVLAWGVHAGALVASLWAMVQFWGGLGIFPQGPQPSSTFINRNFFAEFAVCSLPFGAILLARARRTATIALLAATAGLIVVAILMTGTRSALMTMWLEIALLFPLAAWRCWDQLACAQWPRRLRVVALAVFAGTVLVLGAIPTDNPKILEELHGATPIARGLRRTESIGPNDYSLGVRMVMWRATLNAIRARPLAGLGAGAWESEIPLYQAEGSQLETDYYVHNEFLQLVAEYGVVGWVFLALLLSYLCVAAWRSWRDDGPEADAERPWRAVFLASLLALMIVSCIGFPWRLASTGALFALCLGGLAASDARLGLWRQRLVLPLRWSPAIANGALVGAAACLALALVITQRAAEAERKLVGAAKIALSISAAGDYNNPKYDGLKRQMLQMVREGIAITPHYRKITPMVADELARWGDWADATWIWDSVLTSRPYVVAIITNAARGYASTGQFDKALAYLARARKIQPDAPAVRSLEVVLLARTGKEQQAMQAAKEAMAEGVVDYDMMNTYFLLAWRAHDYALARQVLQRRMDRWPDSRAIGLMQMGAMSNEQGETTQAVQFFRQALAAAAPAERERLAKEVPAALRAQVAGSAPQTSARSR
jgi:O-antigen ligase